MFISYLVHYVSKFEVDKVFVVFIRYNGPFLNLVD